MERYEQQTKGCKRVERLNISGAMKQAVRDAGAVKTPAVFHRKNREGWIVTMKLRTP